MAPPREDDTERQPVLMRPAGLTDWVDQLPFANTQACLDEMVHALEAIGHTQLKASRRAELLEIVAVGYHRLFDAVFPPPRGSGASTFDARRQMLLTSAVRVTSLLASGYERVLTDLVSSRTLWFATNKLQAQALQRSMLFNVLTELETYAGYRNSPPELKGRMIAIHSETLRLKEVRQENPRDGMRAEFGKTAAHLHVRAVLAGIVDPHRVAPNEIWRLFELLEPYADAATMHAGERPGGDPHSVFVIDPAGKKRVLPLASLGEDDIPKDAWYLDANPIVEPVEKQLKSLRAREAGRNDPFRWEGRDVVLLARALEAFRGATEREDPRQHARQPVELAFGVTACHFGMSGPPVDADMAAFRTAAPPPPPPPGEPGDDSMKMIDPRTGGTIDVAVQRAHKGPAGRADAATEADDDAPRSAQTAGAYRIDQWLIIDATPHGLGVRSQHSDRRLAIGVGELVGVQLRSTKRRLGIVRWLSIDDEGHYRAGIEYLQGLPEPVAVREIDPKAGPGSRRPGIALLPNRGMRTPSLVALLGTQQKHNLFLLERGGPQGPLEIRTLSMMDRTHFFERLGFEVARPAGKPTA